MSTADDKFEIQSLAQRYADAVMRHDSNDWSATWAEDGEWHLPGHTVVGRSKIRTTWESAMAGYPFAVFLVQPSMVTVNGDTATSRSYVTEILRSAAGESFRVYGVYNDDLVRTAEGWKFKRRKYSVLYRGPVDLSGEMHAYPK